MNTKPKVSSRNRASPSQFCTLCNHKVYNLEAHYQTEEHKRHLRQQAKLWQDGEEGTTK